ncbi:hypothetical protein ACQZ42_13850 [Rhizobium rhizogenes]
MSLWVASVNCESGLRVLFVFLMECISTATGLPLPDRAVSDPISKKLGSKIDRKRAARRSSNKAGSIEHVDGIVDWTGL